MKNLLALFMLMAFATTLPAQIQKGAALLGSTIGLSTGVNISPIIGGFLSDRFAIGGGLGLAVQTADGSSVTSVGFNPFARYYFNGSGMYRIFGQTTVGFQVLDLDDVEGTTTKVFGLGMGVDLFLNDQVALEISLAYLRIKDSESDSGFNNIGLNFGVAAFVGGGKEK